MNLDWERKEERLRVGRKLSEPRAVSFELRGRRVDYSFKYLQKSCWVFAFARPADASRTGHLDGNFEHEI